MTSPDEVSNSSTPAVPSPDTARIKVPIHRCYEIENAGTDKGKRERRCDHDAVGQSAQFTQCAAKLVRSTRVALDCRDGKVTTDQRDR